MPKASRKKKARHGPLADQIAESQEKGYLKAPKNKGGGHVQAPSDSRHIQRTHKAAATMAKAEAAAAAGATPKTVSKMLRKDNSNAMDEDDDADQDDVDDHNVDANIADDMRMHERAPIPSALNAKILATAQQQQHELGVGASSSSSAAAVKSAWGAPASASQSSSSSAAAAAALSPSSAAARVQGRLFSLKDSTGGGGNDDDGDDDDGVLAVPDDEEYEEMEVSAEDAEALSMFMSNAAPTRRNLADMIMDAIKNKAAGSDQDLGGDLAAAQVLKARLDPKVVAVYSQVGKYLSSFTSGKIPKAFKIVPTLRNWEEVLYLTDPEKWSSQAVLAATKIFASNLNPKMAQRYYNLILLPRARLNIEQYKNLNYHIYSAIKKSIFKPDAFYKGILLPLAEDECSLREAVIFSSILAKCSIPIIPSAAALLKLTQMPFTGASTLFMKTLLNKKYNLPYRVVDALAEYFCSFASEQRLLPVVWHQNLLTFAERYKFDLTQRQKSNLKSLLRVKTHHTITEQVRRELCMSAPLDATGMARPERKEQPSSQGRQRQRSMSGKGSRHAKSVMEM